MNECAVSITVQRIHLFIVRSLDTLVYHYANTKRKDMERIIRKHTLVVR